MRGLLSLPALLVLAWAIAGLLAWDRRRRIIAPAQVPWTMAALALVALAMGLLLLFAPAGAAEQAVRAALLALGVYGFATLAARRNGGERGR